jgi:hypothetical protein
MRLAGRYAHVKRCQVSGYFWREKLDSSYFELHRTRTRKIIFLPLCLPNLPASFAPTVIGRAGTPRRVLALFFMPASLPRSPAATTLAGRFLMPILSQASKQGWSVKSESLKFFGLPDADYEIEPRIDHHGLHRISFRSKGYPPQELDMGGAAKLRELMASAGETENVKLLEAAIEKSKGLK